ncbi:hypothetical protein [Aequorivita nionensis]|uniref:hypothetical protein n=1 Tax=Aequorivita nionensis TaxID=1287690 RepID=UPI003965908B
MEQEKDYIKREVRKLTLALMKLIDKTVSANVNNFEAVVFEINEKLNEYFSLSLNEIVTIENSELMNKVKGFHEEHLEKLIELLYQTIQKSEDHDSEFDFEIKELSNNLMLMIDLANDNSKSFSVERMNMKSQLIKNSNKK